MIGLYVHIPFCPSLKCPYCDFYSVPFNPELAYSYSQAVIRNLKEYNDSFDTVYFGGGTPSLMPWEITQILAKAHCELNCEITIESNPGGLSTGDLIMLKNSGVNRISIGVQSFSDSELYYIGRNHTAETAINSIRLAYDSGFFNISADLMLGIPYQTADSVKRSIDMLGKLPLTHVSAYMLKIEPNTPFSSKPPVLPDEDTVADIYLTAANELEKLGFLQYEVSNFAKPGFECKHNLKYWKSETYLGIGAGAHSYYFGERFYVTKDIKGFIDSHTQQTIPIGSEADEASAFADYAMLKLRLTEGLTYKECQRFGIGRAELEKRLLNIPEGHVTIDADRIYLTKKGFLLSNSIIAKIIYE
ncbi:MAG: radical SAM family heme chaperone HemW [Eubacterium sp.]|jgi:oxygen-independent coproporphyrinogen-3 oxidase|nr:radical SAM family heme chaperone HemW [Eubacterium sp.]